MNIVWKTGKVILKLTWVLFKMALIVMNACFDSKVRPIPVCGAFEAHMRRDEETISEGDFYIATHQD